MGWGTGTPKQPPKDKAPWEAEAPKAEPSNGKADPVTIAFSLGGYMFTFEIALVGMEKIKEAA